MDKKYYDLDFKLGIIREFYSFDVTCQGTRPVALFAFFESIDFEDAIRNAIFVGGNSDTIVAITGTIAEAYYGIYEEIEEKGIDYLSNHFKRIYLNYK